MRVDAGLWDVCPEPLSSRLHPGLLDQHGIAAFCRPFALDAWIVEAANRAALGSIEVAEREALYRHLLGEGAKLGRKALAALKRSPVVRDHRGNWVAPDDLAQLPPTQASFLSAVVSAPAPGLAKRTDFLRHLRIRRKLVADDLIRFAPTIDGDAATAAGFEELLARNLTLLTPKAVAPLRSIPILKSRTGVLMAPEQLHLPTPASLACLETEGAIVAGGNSALYRRLGCRERPSAQTLIKVLEQLRDRGSPPARPDIFYPTLVEALRDEKLLPAAHVDEAILWVSGTYHTPRDTLVSPRIPRLFSVASPIFHGPEAITRAYEDFGASPSPRDHHWIKFFQSFAKPADTRGKVRTAAERKLLRDAYQRRAQLGLPDGLAETTPCLLSRDGTLHPLQELRSAVFLEDDYPQLATALAEIGGKIAFADIVEGSRPFFLGLKLGRLTDACGTPRIETGSPCAPPNWFRPSHHADFLSLLQNQDFAIALREMAWSRQRQVPDFRAPRTADLRRRLAEITQFLFVSKIGRVYRIGEVRPWVAAEAATTGDAIALLPARNMVELEQMLAFALAELAGAARLADARALAVAILPLLRCRTRGEMLAYLIRQGSVPPEWSGIEPEFPESEPEDEPATRAEAIVRELIGGLNTGPRPADDRPRIEGPVTPPPATTPVPDTAPSPVVLPPIDTVRVAVASVSDAGIVRPVSGSGSGGHGAGGWTPPSSAEVERDRLVGARGEDWSIAWRLSGCARPGMRTRNSMSSGPRGPIPEPTTT